MTLPAIRPRADLTIYPVTEPAGLRRALGWVGERAGEVLGLDLETNAYDPFDPRFCTRSVQIADANTALVLDAERLPADGLAELLRRHEPWVAHFSENDIRFAHRGLPGSIRTDQFDRPHVLDSQTALAWLNPRTVTSQDDAYGSIPLPKGLKEAVTRELGDPILREAETALHRLFDELAPKGMRKQQDRKAHGFRTVPFDDPRYLLYGGLDAIMGLRLYQHAITECTRRGQLPGLREDLWLQWQLDLATLRGQPLDEPYVRWINRQLLDAVAVHVDDLARYGVPPSGMGPAVGEAFERLGFTSSKINRKSGNLSYDKHVVSALIDRPDAVGDLARRVTAVRKASKFRSAYVQPMLDALERDCRIHPSMRAVGAITGRNSAARPAVQQLPKKDSRIRAAICALPGWSIVTADFSQGEPRTMAGLSGDRRLLHDLLLGDLNSSVAGAVYGDQFDPALGQVLDTPHYLMRQGGKAAFLACCYGAQDRKLAETLAKDQAPGIVPVTAAPREAWRGQYPDLFRLSDDLNARRFVQLENTWVVPLWDRAWISDDGVIRDRGKPSRKGLNAAAQGTQRLLLQHALRRFVAAGWGWSLLLLMHDEIVAMVPTWMVEEVSAALKDAMTMTYRGVPIECSVEVCGRTWTRQPADFDVSLNGLLDLPEPDDPSADGAT